MIKKIIYWMLIIVASLIIGNYLYQYLFNKIYTMFIHKYIYCFYESPTLESDYNAIVENIQAYFNNFWDNIKIFFISIFNYLISYEFMMLLMILSQFIIIFYIIIIVLNDKKNIKYTFTKPAKFLIYIVNKIKKLVYGFIDYLNKNKKIIIITFLILSGILPVLILESFIFLIIYLFSVFTFSTHLIVMNVFKFCVVKIVHFIMFGDRFLLFIIISLLLWLLIITSAWKKMRINWVKFKLFIDAGATVNFVEGEPGAGKTLTLVQAGLASTENILDMYEKEILEWELNNPEVNFSKIRLYFKILFMDFNVEDIDNVIATAPDFLFELFELEKYINCDFARIYFNNYYRGSSIVSFMPMHDPYYNSYTRIGDVQSMRFYKKLSQMPYEPDMTIIFPEIDKEFNSHDDKKDVSDDGTFAFFAFLSHLLDRCGGFWGDSQMQSQIIRRVRGVAGKYYHIHERKVKMPLLLSLVYKPLLFIYNRFLRFIISYRGERPLTEKKWTTRRKQVVYRRNDVNLFYQCCKYIGFIFIKVLSYMERFKYFRIYCEVATNEDFNNSKICKYNLNIMNFDHNGDKIYNSTYFKEVYKDLKDILIKDKGINQNLNLMAKWSSLDPEILQYSKLNQRLLSKIISAQLDDEEKD